MPNGIGVREYGRTFLKSTGKIFLNSLHCQSLMFNIYVNFYDINLPSFRDLQILYIVRQTYL